MAVGGDLLGLGRGILGEEPEGPVELAVLHGQRPADELTLLAHAGDQGNPSALDQLGNLVDLFHGRGRHDPNLSRRFKAIGHRRRRST
jgi:hypothetical protein